MDLDKWAVQKIIACCLAEDVGTGDITTNSIVPSGAVTQGMVYAKQAGVIAGIPVAEAVFRYLSPNILFSARIRDGIRVEPGELIAEVKGDARAILTGERLALNFLQRLSGIASSTAILVEKVKEYPVKIVDTRKTVPGLRLLEKYAVRIGGGFNHRFGLYDGILIKDNHIKVAGGITWAIEAARREASHMIKIEIEVEDLAGVVEALTAKADIIMLDNMNPAAMREAVKMVNGQALVEASGGINENTVLAVAQTGVDLISVGALTHSAGALDISLDIGEIKTTGKYTLPQG